MVRGEDLEEALSRRGWDRRRAAKELGVTTRTVYRWAVGDSHPRGDHLERVYKVLPELRPALPKSIDQIAQELSSLRVHVEDLDRVIRRLLVREVGEAHEQRG